MNEVDYYRAAIVTNGGNPTSYSPVGALRQLVQTYGGSPQSYSEIKLLREAVVAVGSTPTRWSYVALLRELLVGMGQTVTSFRPRDLLAQLGGAVSGPSVQLSAATVAENASTNTVIGALSVINHPSGSSGWTFAITSQTPSGKLNISSANLRTNAALDYEANPTLSVTVTASKTVQSDIVKVFTVNVTNVFEAATLAALGFDDSSFPEDTAKTVNITSATSGSTLTVQAGSLPAGMTLNSGARTIAGTPTTASTGSATIRETLADSANSPRDTVWNWTIEADVITGDPRLPPTLELDDNTTYPPPLSILLTDPDLAVNDVMEVQASTSVAFTSPFIDVDVVLTSGILAGDQATIPGLSSISSPAETYFRARINGGDWSDIVKHGDTTAPTITSDLTPSTVENAPWSITLTADEEIALWEIVSGPSGATLVDDEFTFDDADYETATSYSWVIRATDYGGNSTTETMVLTVTNDATDDPTAAELTSTTGTGKSQYVTVSGSPKLHYLGAATGAPMMVRATLPSGPTKFQFEMTCTADNGQLLMGIDDGTDNLDGFDLPGNGDTHAVLLRMERPAYGDSDSWYGTSEYEGTASLALGDTVTMTCDEAGSVSWYRTRSGVTTLVGTRTVAPFSNWYAIVGSNFTAEFDVKFGSGQVRALDSGYGTYDA